MQTNPPVSPNTNPFGQRQMNRTTTSYVPDYSTQPRSNMVYIQDDELSPDFHNNFSNPATPGTRTNQMNTTTPPLPFNRTRENTFTFTSPSNMPSYNTDNKEMPRNQQNNAYGTIPLYPIISVSPDIQVSPNMQMYPNASGRINQKQTMQRQMQTNEPQRNLLRGNPYYTPIGTQLYPYYYENANDVENDLIYLRQLYPRQVRAILNQVTDSLDQLEYEGSVIFDAYPDRVYLSRMVDRIYGMLLNSGAIIENSFPNNGEMSCYRIIVEILFYHEMFERRRRYRSRSRSF